MGLNSGFGTFFNLPPFKEFLSPRHVVTDDNSVDAASAAAAVFAAAPFVEERELRQLDVPDESPS